MDFLKRTLLDKETQKTVDSLKELNSKEQSLCVSPIIEEKQIVIHETCKIGDNTFRDLELFRDYNDTSDNTVTNVISKSLFLHGSHAYFDAILANPIHNVGKLRDRQLVIRNMACRTDIDHVRELLTTLRKHECDMLWLYDSDVIGDSSGGLGPLYSMVYFNYRFTRNLNHSDIALTAYNVYQIIVSPLIGIMSPIMYCIVPYLVLRYKLGIKISFYWYIRTMLSTLLSGGPSFGPTMDKLKWVSYVFSIVFYFQGLFNSIEISKVVYSISKTITTKMNGIVTYIKTSKKLHDLLWNTDMGTHFITDQTSFIDDLPNVEYFEANNFGQFSVFSNFGKQLKIYKKFVKSSYIPLFRRVYMIDTLFCVSQLSSFSYVKFVQHDTRPQIRMDGFWHPCLEHVVKNDVYLGDEFQNNMIITGPNAGGKSTTIKSMLINVILAQTLSLSPVDKFSLTPFYYISTQINIPDCKGKESLFEAEMYRSKRNLDVINKLGPSQFSILAMDEIFNSTNPVEGIAGAYAIAKKLATFDNNVSIISTHYLYLTRLSKDVPLSFKSYKMNVELDAITGDVLKYPYKLAPGISRQYIALELLRRNEFDPDIIKEAMIIKERMMKPIRYATTVSTEKVTNDKVATEEATEEATNEVAA